jgi:hypothetical protein
MAPSREQRDALLTIKRIADAVIARSTKRRTAQRPARCTPR